MCFSVFEEPEDPSSRSFFSEIISSISDVKFSHSGRYMMTRDYLSVKVWDLNMESRPVETHQVRPPRRDGAHLRTTLSNLPVVSLRSTSTCEASFVLCTKTTASLTSSSAAGAVRTGRAHVVMDRPRARGPQGCRAVLCRPPACWSGGFKVEKRGHLSSCSPYDPVRIQTVPMALRFLLAVFKMLFKYFQNNFSYFQDE